MTLSQFLTHPLIIALLSTVALRITAWLFLHDQKTATDQTNHSVLQSHWSRVGPIPVSLLASVLYAATLVTALLLHFESSLQPICEKILSAIAPMIAGGTLWFIILQRFILKRICKWCAIANFLGLFIAACLFKKLLNSGMDIRSVVVGSSGVVGLIVMQLLNRKNNSYTHPT